MYKVSQSKINTHRVYILIKISCIFLYHSNLSTMKKKTIFLLLILTGILPIACCPESPSGPYLINLYSVVPLEDEFLTNKSNPDGDYFIPQNSTYLGDTLILSLGVYLPLAQNTFDFSLQSAAYALSCDEYLNLQQLNDKIIDISVTCNKEFNGIKAGEILNKMVIAFNEDFNSPVPLEQAISITNDINGNEYLQRQGLRTLAITEKPTSSFERTFTVKIDYESGKQEVVESSPIIW